MNEQQQKEWQEFQNYKNNKGNGKKKWLWGCGGCLGAFIILAILFGACAAMFTGGENPIDTNKNSETKTKEYKIGDTAKNGDIEVTVKSVETANQVGPSALPASAKDTFVIANVSIKNKGKESLTIDTNMFKLKSGDKTANADAGASTSANQSEDGTITNSFFLEQVNPDSTVEGKVVFDVSNEFANATNKKLEITSKLFSSDKVTFKLNGTKETTKKNKRDKSLKTEEIQQVVNDQPSNEQDNSTEQQQSAQPKQERISQKEYDNTKTTTHDESQLDDPMYQRYQEAQQFTKDFEANPDKYSGIGGGPGMTSDSNETYEQYANKVNQANSQVIEE